ADVCSSDLALAAPQDEVLDLHGEERGKAALLRTMLRIARRTTRPWAKPDDSPAENAPQRTSFCFLPRGATAAGADRRGNCSAGRPESPGRCTPGAPGTPPC